MRNAQMWQVVWLQGAMERWMMGLAQMKQTSPSASPSDCSESSVLGLGSGGRRSASLGFCVVLPWAASAGAAVL